MSKQLSRRQFLKTGSAGGLALAFAPLLASPVHAEPHNAPLPERVVQAAAASPWTALPSSLPLGQPLADISMGWDGSVWAIDINGVPHQYDQVAQTWQVYGSGVDAVALNPAGGSIVVNGAQVTVADTNLGLPQPLASAWQNLPDSFADGLDGVATANKTVYLFRHGRYLAINPSTNAPAGPPQALTALASWPPTPAWQAGAIDAVGANTTDLNDPQITLWSGAEFLTVDLTQQRVVGGPQQVATVFGEQIAGVIAKGVDCVWYDPDPNMGMLQVFQGPLVWIRFNATGTVQVVYLNSYTSLWAPTLGHAPSGVTGALWAAGPGETDTKVAYYHDGTSWQPGPQPSGSIVWATAGQDGAVFGLIERGSGNELYQLAADSSGWNRLAAAPSNAVQVSAGDADHIWMRDSSNGVWRVSGGTSSAVNLGQAATHIAANADGTLWHAGTGAAAYRFISEGTAPSTALTVGAGISAVTSVASTGFGAAFVLARTGAASSPQLYGYTSRYAWKTAASYYSNFSYAQFPNAIACGGHSVFVVADNPSPTSDNVLIVALDAQTGAELWPQPFTNTSLASGTLIFDATLNLVYVASGTMLYALDAAGGTQVWSLDVGGDVGDDLDYGQLGTPTLANGLLSVGRSDGVVVLLDTGAALASARQQQPITSLWRSTELTDPDQDGPVVNIGAPAVDASGTLYVQGQLAGDTTYQPTVVALDGGSGATLWSRSLPIASSQASDALPADVVLGTTTAPNGTTGVPALFVNAGTQIYALDPSTGSTIHTYTLPAPPSSNNIITSAMAYRGGRLYVGDVGGTLRVIDATTLEVITQTSDTVSTQYGVLGQPVLIADDASNDVVAMFTRGDQSVWLFDPDSGTLEQIATDLTAPGSLAYDDTHGLLYAMGWNYNWSGSDLVGQVFAIRPDQAIQAERAFLIESQLMQDFATDAEAQGTGVARYQTHVTVVDRNNVGLANASVKMWSDDDATAVLIDTQAFTVGPQTPALFTTDATGSFTITSVATDLQTTTLQLWAAFMDASERITITPDTEFHARLAATTATGATDPTAVDMRSATAYDGTTLFASSEQSQAQDAATAVTQLTAAVGIGASTSAAQATLPKYTTAASLSGMRYTAVSTAYTQAVSVGAPLGFRLDAGGHTPLTPAAAADLIDTLTGAEPDQALLGSVFSKLKAAWSEIKATAATVTQVVVSAATEVYVGIQYVVNGVITVVKQVVADVKDAMAVVGALLIQLGRDLPNAIEALSLLLHLDQIFDTAKIIRGLFTTMATGLPDVLANNAFPAVESYLGNLSSTVKGTFGNLIATLEGGTGTTAQPSGPSWAQLTKGATPNSVLTVAPPDGSAPPKSVAVQGMWGIHTVRKNSTAIRQPSAVGAPQSDPISAALAGFLGDGATRSASLTPILSQFGSGLKLNSPQAILDVAIADLLTLAEAALVAGIDIMQDLVMALRSVVSDIAASWSDGGAITVPVLSTLWARTGLPGLTVLDLITFVAAIPVTLVYYVLSGHWLSADLPSVDAAALGGANGMIMARAFGIIGAIISIVAGYFSALNDTLYVATEGASSMIDGLWASILNYTLLVLLCVGPIYAGSTNPTSAAYWVTVGLTIIANLISAFSSKVGGAEAGPIWTMISWLFAIGILVANYEGDTTTKQGTLTVVGDALANVPGIVSVVKLIADPEAIIPFAAPVADLGCMLAAAGITLAVTVTNWNTEPDQPPPAPTPSPSPAPRRFRMWLPRIHRGG